jgi:hypothetical protein
MTGMNVNILEEENVRLRLVDFVVLPPETL